MYKGSCLCGQVRYEVAGSIDDIVFCHCSLCRKAQGSAFATNGNVEAKHFRFIQGSDNLTQYESNPGHSKYFCTTCGSPVMSLNERVPDTIRIRLGSIESDITERPTCHIFTDSKAIWENICDDLPQYKEYKT